MLAHSHFVQDLVDDIKGELSGDFEKTILALMIKPAEYMASEVKRAIKGLGTDEAVLVEVLCTRTNEEMTALKEAYKKSESALFINVQCLCTWVMVVCVCVCACILWCLVDQLFKKFN